MNERQKTEVGLWWCSPTEYFCPHPDYTEILTKPQQSQVKATEWTLTKTSTWYLFWFFSYCTAAVFNTVTLTYRNNLLYIIFPNLHYHFNFYWTLWKSFSLSLHVSAKTGQLNRWVYFGFSRLMDPREGQRSKEAWDDGTLPGPVMVRWTLLLPGTLPLLSARPFSHRSAKHMTTRQASQVGCLDPEQDH